MLKKNLTILFILLFTANGTTQNKTIQGLNKTILPFKGGMMYDGRSEEELLKEIENGEEPASNLNIKFSDFMVSIYSYGVYETVVNYKNQESVYIDDLAETKDLNIEVLDLNRCYLMPLKDTTVLNEWTFNDLSNKILKITPNEKEKDVSFKLSAQLYERIWQQMPKDMDYERWENIAQEWKGISPSVEIKDSANYYFKLPEIQNLSDYNDLYKNLALRDTLVVIEGEYDSVATIVYNDRPSIFIIDNILLRIDKYRKEMLIETKYIRIVFSYGC